MDKYKSSPVRLLRGIASKYAALTFVIVMATAASILFLQYREARTSLIDREFERLDFALQQESKFLSDVIDDATRKTLFLVNAPSVRNIINHQQNDEAGELEEIVLQSYKEQLAGIFLSLAESNPDILQIRFIEASEVGREIVRVTRASGQPRITSNDMLQLKGDQEYVYKTAHAAPGEVLIFDINLNREYGRIERPYTPVLRTASPVFSDSGEVFGVVVINIDMNQVFKRMTEGLVHGSSYYVTNSDGYYLIHPDSMKTFGFEFGKENRVDLDYPKFKKLLDDQEELVLSITAGSGENAQLLRAEKFFYDPTDRSRFLLGVAMSPKRALLADIGEIRDGLILISIFLAIISAGIATLVSRLVIYRLKKLKTAVEHLANGTPVEELELPTELSDEIGVVAKAFEEMATSLKERQGRLEEKEATVRAIHEAVSSPIITIDARGAIQDINAATTQLLGYSKEELLGKNVAMLMTSEYSRNHDQYLRNYHEYGEARIIGIGREVEARRNDGTAIPVHIAVSELRIKDKPLYTGVITDLSELKKVDRLKNEFVSTVSHELRTPLTSIKGSLGLLKSATLGDLPDEAIAMITIAYNNSDRLIRLINDILDVEKIEAGKLSFTFQHMELEPFLERSIEANKAYSQEYGVELNLLPIAGDIKIDADADRLAQVMANLISNAVKFSPKGAEVSISAEVLEEEVRISVTDHGPGIPEEFQSKIFGKFAQADSSDTKAQGGTGLGLSISKAIVEAHGGDVSFHTMPGKGTTFYFNIPRVVSEAKSIESAQRMSASRVLICEDDIDVSTLLSLIISDMGYETVVCSTAAEAKDMLQAGEFSAMTVDLALPDQDGLRFIRELREAPETEDLPILVVSAKADAAREELNGTVISVIDWLDKPIHIDQLKSGVERAVKTSHVQNARILHIDDDVEHLKFVTALVGDQGTVDHAKNCREAREQLALVDYDIVILDLLLPDGAGEELLPDIRSNGSAPPQVLVFSVKELPEAFASAVDKVLIKSQISNEVLKRHIQSLIGATTNKSDDVYRDVEYRVAREA
ncbi:ATP-binding protein [Parvularcula marina]|uniref:ATP-binding protein n=1 Tax=Parvularcula marina TaxID=2292771 RepID=UPI00351591ED